MRVRHNFGPENGPQHTAITNQTSENSGTGAYKPHVCPLNRSCRAECRAWQTGSLDGALRYFAEYHDWHESGYLANKLKILLVFKKPVRATANKLLAIGLDGLAAQIKKEFKRLLEMCQPLDDVCGRRIVEEDEAIKLEYTRAYLTESLVELADLIESGQKTAVRDQTSEISGTDAEWVTFGETAKRLGKSKSTVSKWAQKGRFTDNGIKGQKRRLSTASVLLVKQDIEDEYRKKGDDEWHDEFRRTR